jgi:HD-GYP domain-containing protein (c-di-GMP phosphodiesterase class II)
VLARAGDLGMGRPMGTGLKTCVIATRLAKLAGHDVDDAYWLALLQHAGCSAEVHVMAEVFGDELEIRTVLSLLDKQNLRQVVPAFWRQAGGVAAFARMFAGLPRVIETNAATCDVALHVARRVHMPERVLRLVPFVQERFDGRGEPNHVKKDGIPAAVRVVHVAEEVALYGDDAKAALAAHSGRALDPAICEAALRALDDLVKPSPSTWDEVLSLEPGEHRALDDDHVDDVLRALADVTDLLSPSFRTHSKDVADVTAHALAILGAGADEQRIGRRAGWLHDLGRIGISARIWEKRGALDDADREQVRLHPYQTERLLDRVVELEAVAQVASHAHERHDGSGYPNATTTTSRIAAVLAAADVFCALREDRPHRDALDDDAAAKLLQSLPLSPDAVRAVLATIGKRAPMTSWPDGLTDREVAVLRLVARGLTNKEIGNELGISAKTAGNHLQNLFPKLKVTTRAAATMYAMQHGLAR